MFKVAFNFILPAACVFVVSASAANTNSLVWHTATDRVSADMHGESLWPLLEDIAHQTGWHIFVEPDTERNVSAKFKDLPSGDALKMLLGDLNFALVPQTNAPVAALRFPHQHAERDAAGEHPPSRRQAHVQRIACEGQTGRGH